VVVSGKTVAGIFLAGIILALFLGYIAQSFNYLFASMGNSTQGFEEAYEGNATTTTNKIGNYTIILVEPHNDAYRSIFDSVYNLWSMIVNALSDKITLAIIIALSLIVSAIVTRR